MSTAERLDTLPRPSQDEGADQEPEQTQEQTLDLDDFGKAEVDDVRMYLNTIGRVALLNAEQEVILSRQIEAGLFAQSILDDLQSPDQKFREAKLEIARSLFKAATTTIEQEDEKTVEDNEHSESTADAAKEQKQVDASADDTILLRDLRQLAREGEAAKKRMTEANLRLVVSIAKRYAGRGMAFLDLIQEGNLGLIRAVEKFDYTKGFKFSTYATWWVRQAITRGMADQSRTVRIPVHLHEKITTMKRKSNDLLGDLGREPTPEELAKELDITVEKLLDLQDISREPVSLDLRVGDDDKTLGDFVGDEDQDDVDNPVMHRMMVDDLNRVLGTLDEREAEVVRLRMGMTDGRQYTLDAIGKRFGVTRERVRQIEIGAMKKLRRPARAEALSEYRSGASPK